MADFQKGDIVRYGKEEYTVGNIRQIPYGEHYREKAIIIDKDGNQFWVDTKDLKPISKEFNLDALIKEAKKEEKKTIDENEKAKSFEQIKDNLNKEEKKARAVSFSVITRDYVNGRSNGYEPKETVISGRTKDGVNYEATIYGKDINRGTLEKIADNTAKEADLTTSKQDRAFAMDRINGMLNDNNADYVVYIDGDYKTGFEINDDLTLEEAENLEDFGDLYPENNNRAESFEDLIPTSAVSNDKGYSSPGYDDPEEEFDDLLALSGVTDITEL